MYSSHTLSSSLFLYPHRIARKRGVFKVETIGDSYVAVTGKSSRIEWSLMRFKSFAPNLLPSVHLSHHCHYYYPSTGLPDPQEDHAVIMARFARDCNVSMKEVTRKLELTLGPDTGDLRMRSGLHSGPVTAGVLRGDRARFQLFG